MAAPRKVHVEDANFRVVTVPSGERNASGSSLGHEIHGTALVFDSPSGVVEGAKEIIDGKAAIGWDDPRALINHDWDKVIGRRSAGTLELNRTKTGIDVVIRPPNTQPARDLVANIREGNVRGMSFNMGIPFRDWQFSMGMRNGEPHRLVTEIKNLKEVSIVTDPAYLATEQAMSVRSLEDELAEWQETYQKDLERWKAYEAMKAEGV